VLHSKNHYPNYQVYIDLYIDMHHYIWSRTVEQQAFGLRMAAKKSLAVASVTAAAAVAREEEVALHLEKALKSTT
jgi:hypothetical protein